LLSKDLESTTAQGRPFAYVFAPEVSHGPWVDSIRSMQSSDAREIGQRLLEMSDTYLGRIMDLLARQNQLTRTIIVVVGDHGVRTRVEDPRLATGVMDDYSFHVPLLIYAPMTLKSAQKIPWLTSHIDIAPTVLDLLGVTRNRRWEQGAPVWDPELNRRRTYFLARSYFGIDGYHLNGRFVMWSHISDSVYANNQMKFGPEDVVPCNSPQYVEATAAISRLVGLQEVWVTQFGRADSFRNHLYGSHSANGAH
jgi:Sulfatase